MQVENLSTQVHATFTPAQANRPPVQAQNHLFKQVRHLCVQVVNLYPLIHTGAHLRNQNPTRPPDSAIKFLPVPGTLD